MFKNIVVIFLTIILIYSLFPKDSTAKDVVRIAESQSGLDMRHFYLNAVLNKALEKTKNSYGNFEIKMTISDAQRERALLELIKGEKINVHIAATQKKWEENSIPIRIPILKGLLGYRLLLIKSQNQDKFSSINSVEELKQLKAGLNLHWTTTKVMSKLGFNIIKGGAYDGLFKMLMRDRFDYFPRGVNEVFAEFDCRKKLMPDLKIEPRIALYLPQPTYIFVSPKYPQLAKRIESGLQIMLKDGSLDKLFWEFNKSNIDKANLKNRTIFKLENPLLPPETPFDQKQLWFNPLEKPVN
ncbi:hypothetical protein [Maridesulfovibrio zosterae]|uniref:hypothetical protein n=1 Tax=Maridesulfovibrio zosterae TaxID=82171 RepID=UPI00040143E1|nr:hypothetical protein [Maridesulfovibrio zosterae]